MRHLGCAYSVIPSSKNVSLFLREIFLRETVLPRLVLCVDSLRRPFAHQASDRRQLFMEHYLHFFLGKKIILFCLLRGARNTAEILMQNATREAQFCFCQDLVHYSLLEMFFTLSISHCVSFIASGLNSTVSRGPNHITKVLNCKKVCKYWLVLLAPYSLCFSPCHQWSCMEFEILSSLSKLEQGGLKSTNALFFHCMIYMKSKGRVSWREKISLHPLSKEIPKSFRENLSNAIE